MKVGVELEYWIVNEEGKLVSSKELAENLDFAEQEFVEPLLEIKSRPHENIDGLRSELQEKVGKAVQEAELLDQKIVPLGTPLNSGKIEKISSRRGEIQQEIIGKNLEAAKRVAGTHIHFEKKDVKTQLNTLTALDPALALLNSSPYYQGHKLASSSRNQIYRYRCYQNFPQHGQLWPYVDSVEEWESRIQDAFAEFLEKASQSGIGEKDVRKHFTPYNALWTPVRLRKDFPTVEWRAPDTAKLSTALDFVENAKKAVEDSIKDRNNYLEFKKLQSLSKTAIKHGMQSDTVKKYVSDKGFDTDKYESIDAEIEPLSLKEARKKRLKASYSPR